MNIKLAASIAFVTIGFVAASAEKPSLYETN